MPTPDFPTYAQSFFPIHLVFEDDMTTLLSVVEAEVDLAIGECFDIRLVVKSTTERMLSRLLRAPVSVQFDDEPFVKEIRGIVRRARLVSAEPSGASLYEVWISPPYWRLSRRRNHRIFMGMSVFEIADAVLAEHKLEPLIVGPRTAPKREYTVQYGEDDLHLVQRLLADEGWVASPSLELARLRVVENTQIEGPLGPDLPYADHRASKPATPHVFEVRLLTEMIIGRAVTVDYDWQKPSFVVEGESELFTDFDLEHYEYEVGEVSTTTAATKRAKDTLMAAHSQNYKLECVANCLLEPGTRFKITDHPRYELADPYLVVRSRSTWARTATDAVVARHAYDCLDAIEPYKPRRLEKPRIHGVQTARVVGAPGVEIDVDEHGRVVVEFFWDRRRTATGTTSRRIRVSSAWAGAGLGFEAVPRVGDEVIVAYLDGDADQPLVVGRVHNPTRPNPLKLPSEQTASVWRSRSTPASDGFNEIRMEDKAGAEVLSMHAQQDFAIVALRDAKTEIGRNETHEVRGDYTSRTKGSGDIGFEAGFQMGTPNGGTISARTLDLRGRDASSVATASNRLAGAEVSVEAEGGLAMSGKAVTITGESITLVSGGSKIEVTAEGVTITAPKITVNASGTCDVKGSPILLNC